MPMMTSSRGELFPESGMCLCGTYTDHRCACGEWWCHQCLSRHTSAPGGRCPEAVRLKACNAQRPVT